MIHSPKLFRLRVPGKANGIAQSAGEHLSSLPVETGAKQGSGLLAGLLTRVACASHADVQHAVRADRQRPVRVLAAVGQIAHDLLQLAEGPVLLPVRNKNLLDSCEVRPVPVERNTMQVLFGCDYRLTVGLPIAIRVPKHQTVAGLPPCDVNGPVLSDRDDSRLAQCLGEGVNAKPRRYFQLQNRVSGQIDLRRLGHMRRNLNIY
jgi:hypothetical protein